MFVTLQLSAQATISFPLNEFDDPSFKQIKHVYFDDTLDVQQVDPPHKLYDIRFEDTPFIYVDLGYTPGRIYSLMKSDPDVKLSFVAKTLGKWDIFIWSIILQKNIVVLSETFRDVMPHSVDFSITSPVREMEHCVHSGVNAGYLAE